MSKTKVPPFKMIPVDLREHLHELTEPELKVWLCLVLHSDEYGYAFPSNNLMVRETGMSRSTVKRAKTELRKKGWLVSGQRYRDNGSLSSMGEVVSPNGSMGIGSPMNLYGVTSEPTVGSPVNLGSVTDEPILVSPVTPPEGDTLKEIHSGDTEEESHTTLPRVEQSEKQNPTPAALASAIQTKQDQNLCMACAQRQAIRKLSRNGSTCGVCAACLVAHGDEYREAGFTVVEEATA